MSNRDFADVGGARILRHRRFVDPRGALAVFEGGRDVPFSIARVFSITDVPEGARRADHAHAAATELLCVTRGRCSATTTDGDLSQTFDLTATSGSLLVPPMTWLVLEDFAPDTVLVVLSSTVYDPVGYFYTFEAFRAARRGGAGNP